MSAYVLPSWKSRALKSTCAVSPRVNLGSVVQALRGNSSRTLTVRPGFAVRNGSDWSFALDRFLRSAHSCVRVWEPEHGPPDAMNQVVPVTVNIEERCSKVAFEHVWDGLQSQVSMALFEAMRTNKTVRCLHLLLNDSTLTERHLTAIEDSLLENDTLQSFVILAGLETELMPLACQDDTVRAAFSRILEWNMCLVRMDIRCVIAVPVEVDAEDLRRGTRRFRMRDWPLDLGETVTEAIERNRRAWSVAKQLGQVCKSSRHCFPRLEDIGFRGQLLLFFLEEGCQPPPQLLHILKGLPNH